MLIQQVDEIQGLKRIIIETLNFHQILIVAIITRRDPIFHTF